MDADYLKILVTVLLAVIGWLVGYYFTNKRAIASKRKELVSKYLVSVYRILANEISHRTQTPERDRQLEDLLSDIQIFGSNEQIKLAKSLADQVAAGGTFELDPLINSLRDSLRKELNLSPVSGNIRWLRFSNSEES